PEERRKTHERIPSSARNRDDAIDVCLRGEEPAAAEEPLELVRDRDECDQVDERQQAKDEKARPDVGDGAIEENHRPRSRIQYVNAASAPAPAAAPRYASLCGAWNRTAVTATNWRSVASFPGRLARRSWCASRASRLAARRTTSGSSPISRVPRRSA